MSNGDQREREPSELGFGQIVALSALATVRLSAK